MGVLCQLSCQFTWTQPKAFSVWLSRLNLTACVRLEVSARHLYDRNGEEVLIRRWVLASGYSLTRSYQMGQISSSCDLWIITGELPAAPLADRHHHHLDSSCQHCIAACPQPLDPCNWSCWPVVCRWQVLTNGCHALNRRIAAVVLVNQILEDLGRNVEERGCSGLHRRGPANEL